MIHNMRGAFNPIAIYIPGDMYERDGVTYAVSRGGVHTPVAVPGDESLRGPIGPIGPKGRDGADGKHGRDGHDGASGADGRDGKDGADGKRGPRGFRGYDGDTGVVVKRIETTGTQYGFAIFDVDTVRGQFVRVSESGHVTLAVAGGVREHAMAVGVAIDDVPAGQLGRYQTDGPVSIDTWNLEPGKMYMLDAFTPGGVTSDPQYVLGVSVVQTGVATGPQSMNLNLNYAVYLGFVKGTPAIFDEATKRGFALRESSPSHVAMALADSVENGTVVGLSVKDWPAGKSNGHTATGWVDGEDWTDVVGAEFLNDGADYYLSDVTPGMLTETPPTTPGHVVTKVGTAVSDSILKIDIQPPVLIE